ncbi:LysR family transcriptional regulator [Leptospira bourretii]|uniref:LysR family transcriptional regulator n=1 Tax=Leptospira bourretii TaxID=2484962 RepID=A0A4R9IKG6_9LEPT|nr:LysR family transcriptional regulator [Leptospira bourretii]TGK79546.1 LysR family transcriptional regulator [Leptospira bourretii]TGK89956.1 LysR family transcriptional regulator [Leptospira bourretii]TGL35959.1 LysR family transcriptional regulator [Leptospira bourretii]
MISPIRDLDDLKTFVLVVQERSFTQVAGRLGLTKAAVAKRIQGLEKLWNTQLFYRNTRKVIPTREADLIFPKVISVIESVKELENSLTNKDELEGILRVTCVSSMAKNFISEIIEKFQEQNPKITIQLIVTDSLLDLMEESIDIGIRVGTEIPSGLVGMELFKNKISIVASPLYLKTRKKILSPKDLETHNLLYLELHKTIQFSGTHLSLSDVTKERYFLSNDAASLVQMGLKGKGVLIRSFWDIEEYIQEGKLIPILTDQSLENFGSVWVIHPSNRTPSRRMMVFRNFLESECSLRFNQ